MPRHLTLIAPVAIAAVAVILVTCLVMPASAQAEDPWASITSTDANGGSVESEMSPVPAEQVDIDWSVLNTDPWSFANKPPIARKKLGFAPSDAWTWSRSDKDGAAAVTIKQPLSPVWDTRVGADLNVTTQTPVTSSEVLAQKIAHDNQLSRSSGSAWAAVTAPGLGSVWDQTAIEARTDPGQDQSRFGTSLSKSLPLDGGHYSLTLQNGYNVTQQTLVPVFGVGASSRVFEINQSAKLGIAETGTSFIAGQTHSTAYDKWLRRIGAEQKILGGVTVTGSVSETPVGAPNSSLSAGFKRIW